MDKLFLLPVAVVVLVVCNGCNKGGSSTAGGEDSSSEDSPTGGAGDSAGGAAGSAGNGGASNQTGGGTGGNGGSGGVVVAGGNGGSASSGGNGGQGGVFVPSAAKQTKRDRGSTKAAFGFYEYLPPGYNDGVARPLLVYFHGIAENGNGTSDLQNVLLMGPPSLIAAGKWPASRPWVVLSAQWGGIDTCPTADFIQSVIDHGKSNYNIDPKRIHLTGLSCGAIGGWDYLGKYLNADVSAAVLIAGKGKSAFDSKGCQLAKTAIWALHGDMDGVILPEESMEIMPKLMACPQPRMDQVFTLYPGVGHDSWTKTYDLAAGHDIYKWMLANPKP